MTSVALPRGERAESRLLREVDGVLEIRLDGEAVRTVAEWRHAAYRKRGASWQARLRLHAEREGEAVAVRADGRVVWLFSDCGWIRSRTLAGVRVLPTLPRE